jgi:hypothetical protein
MFHDRRALRTYQSTDFNNYWFHYKLMPFFFYELICAGKTFIIYSKAYNYLYTLALARLGNLASEAGGTQSAVFTYFRALL